MSDTLQTPPAHWGPHAVQAMIERKQTIEDFLRKQRRWDEFTAQIKRWRVDFLDDQPFAAGPTAQALYGICKTFDLLEIVGQGPRLSPPTLGARPFGASRTRGAAPHAGPNLEATMRQLASVFG